MGLMAEAHCRHRGRRLCSMEELQHFSQCAYGSGAEPMATLSLGCFRPFTVETGPREYVWAICEFAAEMVPQAEEGRRGRPLVRALVHTELDERGYGQLYLIDNNAVSCNGGNVNTRCCLDL